MAAIARAADQTAAKDVSALIRAGITDETEIIEQMMPQLGKILKHGVSGLDHFQRMTLGILLIEDLIDWFDDTDNLAPLGHLGQHLIKTLTARKRYCGKVLGA